MERPNRKRMIFIIDQLNRSHKDEPMKRFIQITFLSCIVCCLQQMKIIIYQNHWWLSCFAKNKREKIKCPLLKSHSSIIKRKKSLYFMSSLNLFQANQLEFCQNIHHPKLFKHPTTRS